MIGVFRRSDLPRPPALPEVGLALWHVGDPGNIGTLVRAADAFGPAFIATSAGSADPTGPKALRASMGAIFRVPLVGFDEAPGRKVALVAHGGRPLEASALSGATTFVLGAEREGLPEDVLSSCDERVTISLAAESDSCGDAVELNRLGARPAARQIRAGRSNPRCVLPVVQICGAPRRGERLTASTRYVERSTWQSWPAFNSGTSTLR